MICSNLMSDVNLDSSPKSPLSLKQSQNPFSICLNLIAIVWGERGLFDKARQKENLYGYQPKSKS